MCLRFSLKHIRVPVELRYLQNALLKHPDSPSERYIIRMTPLKLSSCFNIQTVVSVRIQLLFFVLFFVKIQTCFHYILHLT